uniref:Uncharacterized protein n=1 Tax=Anguilla anguilla TaxID=7936 RepID=A0A0E9QP82_ANGAN
MQLANWYGEDMSPSNVIRTNDKYLD